MLLNKSLQVRTIHTFKLKHTYSRQEINIQNMNVELVAQMFKNYQSNVLFHLEGTFASHPLFKFNVAKTLKPRIL